MSKSGHERFGEAWDFLFHPPIAHRGLWSPDGAPENSLGAFQAACQAGYGIELDVQLSADGEAMVFHDYSLKRMTGREGKLKDYTAADLGEIRLNGTDERIPTLMETLAVIGHRAMVHVELKTPFGEVGPLEQRVHEILIDHAGPVCVIGFNPYSHAWFAERFPGVLRGLDSWSWLDKDTPFLSPEQRVAFRKLEQVSIAKPHFLAMSLDTALSPEAQAYREKGMPLVAWTVRQPEQWEPLKDHCDNLIFEGFQGVTLKSAVQVSRRIAEIGRDGWDACASNPDYAANPFMSFDFLDIAEASGCAVERQGWGPQHLSVEDEAGRVAAVMPLYLKSHSQGEYIFDHAWADAYERVGGAYYPKLLCAAPFTPATGPRLLVRPDVDADEARRILLGGAVALTERYDASSLHINFPLEEEWNWLGAQGLAQRQGQQYHWLNAGYASFEDFLGALSSGRRKTIRRERRDAQAGVEIVCLTGDDITEDHWDAFFAFYMDTGSRKWGRPYLNRLFFSLLGERMADRVLLVMARRNDRWIAGALNLIGADCLYGRNWGCIEDIPFLHFELCYYQAIEWAIGRGLARVEAGAQGQHKIARGYLPAPVRSAHFIADPRLRAAVADFCDRERLAVQGEMEWLSDEYSPFREGDGPAGN